MFKLEASRRKKRTLYQRAITATPTNPTNPAKLAATTRAAAPGLLVAGDALPEVDEPEPLPLVVEPPPLVVEPLPLVEELPEPVEVDCINLLVIILEN